METMTLVFRERVGSGLDSKTQELARLDTAFIPTKGDRVRVPGHEADGPFLVERVEWDYPKREVLCQITYTSGV